MSNTLNVEISGNKIRMTKELTLTVAILEEKLKRITYTGMGKVKNSEVENTLFPPVALSFYEYIFKYNDIPNCDDIVEIYFNKYFNYIANNQVSIMINGRERVFNYEAVKARILRTYPSLVRDLHFCLLIQESGQLGNVYYNFENDYKKAVDLELYYNNHKFTVALRIATQRSLFYKEVKKNRHDNLPSDIIDVELELNSNTYKVGDFYLYGKNELRFLKSEIEKRICK